MECGFSVKSRKPIVNNRVDWNGSVNRTAHKHTTIEGRPLLGNGVVNTPGINGNDVFCGVRPKAI
jgi:hypothetical protein